MEYRKLGDTGLEVSEIGFGGWAIGGNAFGNSYGSTDDATSMKAVEKALDLGCNFFDTADLYGHGHSEELLGKAFKGRRDRIIIATKVGGDFYQEGQIQPNFQPNYVRRALEKSLERLQTDFIDLYQLHNPPFPSIQHGSIFEIFEKLQHEGKIRYYGISIFNPQEGVEAVTRSSVAAVQMVYNLFSQDTVEILKQGLAGKNTAIIAREPLANGYFSGRYTKDSRFEDGDIRQNMPAPYRESLLHAISMLSFLVKEGERSLVQSAIRFALDNPDVSVVIAGAKTPEQVEENFASAEISPLAEEERTRARDLFTKRWED